MHVARLAWAQDSRNSAPGEAKPDALAGAGDHSGRVDSAPRPESDRRQAPARGALGLQRPQSHDARALRSGPRTLAVLMTVGDLQAGDLVELERFQLPPSRGQ